MATQEELTDEIADRQISIIDDSVNKLTDEIPVIQRKILRELIPLLSQLDLTPDGKIKPTGKNIKYIKTVIKTKIRNIVINDKYKESVNKYIESIDKVAENTNRNARIQSR